MFREVRALILRHSCEGALETSTFGLADSKSTQRRVALTFLAVPGVISVRTKWRAVVCVGLHLSLAMTL